MAKFDPSAPPTPAELKAAKQLLVQDEECKEVTLGSLLDAGELPVIAIWIRHFVSRLAEPEGSTVTLLLAPSLAAEPQSTDFHQPTVLWTLSR